MLAGAVGIDIILFPFLEDGYFGMTDIHIKSVSALLRKTFWKLLRFIIPFHSPKHPTSILPCECLIV